MANKTIPMLYQRRIIQLKQTGASNRKIARILGIDRKTVNEYTSRIMQQRGTYQGLDELDDGQLALLLQPTLPAVSKDAKRIDFEQQLPDFIKKLRDTNTTRMVLWESYRAANPQGDGYGYSQFCELLNREMQHKQAVLTHRHVAADAVYFDFAGDTLNYVDPDTGELIKCPVFIAVLPYSNFIYAEVLPCQKREHVLSAMNNMLAYFGGVPRSCKSDNMAQYVSKSNRYEPIFDQLVQQWSLHYNTTLLATRVKKPRDKAAVESAVNTVYKRIYPFINPQSKSLQQLRSGLNEALEKLNDRPMQKHGQSRRQIFIAEEKMHLGVLPETEFVQKLSTTVKVQRNYHITITSEKQSYSVPYQYIGKHVRVIYDTDHVEIYYIHERIAVHQRSYRKASYTTESAHMPSAHQKVRGWNEEYFLQKATEVGSNTAEAIQHILSQRIFIEQTYKSCLGVLQLQVRYGTARLEAACGRALTGPRINYRTIRDILQRGLDRAIPNVDLFACSLPIHENLRGAESYQS
jgi:transposase